MGCGSSKEKTCRKCQSVYSPVKRVPPWQTGENYHVVSLTSSTLGSLKFDAMLHVFEQKVNQRATEEKKRHLIGNEDIVPLSSIDAKTWSKMIDKKMPKIIPKTPIRTPPGEPEVINAWEMMEGLEEVSHISDSSLPSSIDQRNRSSENSGLYSSSNDTSLVSEYDRDGEKCATKVKNEENANGTVSVNKVTPRGAEKLTVYFTSLRGVRKTFEDCCHVIVVLKGLGVKVDERDVSMHSGFKEELKELLEEASFRLPKVFLGRKCIGGAEEIRRLNEEGKLEKMARNCEIVGDGGGNGEVCEACGDIRFVPCETCSGSCKIYYDDEVEEECNESEDERGFHRCSYCNENGLIRCPICCD